MSFNKSRNNSLNKFMILGFFINQHLTAFLTADVELIREKYYIGSLSVATSILLFERLE